MTEMTTIRRKIALLPSENLKHCANELFEAELLHSNLERLRPQLRHDVEQLTQEAESARKDVWEEHCESLLIEAQGARTLIVDAWAARALSGADRDYAALLRQVLPCPDAAEVEASQRRMAEELGIQITEFMKR